MCLYSRDALFAFLAQQGRVFHPVRLVKIREASFFNGMCDFLRLAKEYKFCDDKE